MATYKNIEKIDDYITIATIGKTYHARIKLSITNKRGNVLRKWTSLKVDFDGTSKQRNLAIRKAYTLQEDQQERADASLTLKPLSFTKLSNELIREWRNNAKHNEALEKSGQFNKDKYIKVEHGKMLKDETKSVWSMPLYNSYRRGIKELQTYLESINKADMPLRDLNDHIFKNFISWRSKTQPTRTQSTYNKYRSALRKVYLIAVDRGELPNENSIPTFSYNEATYNAKREEIELTRGNIQDILNYTLDRAMRYKEKGLSEWHVYYQYHLLLGMTIHSGIRPPSQKKTHIQDKHFYEEGGIGYLKRHNMKGITYDALCLEGFKDYYDKAIALKEEYEVKSPYTICHLEHKHTRVKGEPILDFRKQKDNFIDALKLPNFRHYEFRDYYISELLDEGYDILQLARLTGTSIKMIEKIYYRKQLKSDIVKKMAKTKLT